MELILESPCYGVKPLKFLWTEYKSNDIVETVKWVSKEFPDLESAIIHNVLQSYEPTNYRSMRALCYRFNKAITSFKKLEHGTSFPQKRCKKPSDGLLKHILQTTYNQSVQNPGKLNLYEPFSAEVYGETSHDFIFQMIQQIKITSDDIFIDLGSGVGQVVLQMAAATCCNLSIGIERADTPCQYAENMASYFKTLMGWFGKSYGEFKLLKGDFFDKKFKDLIKKSTIIFINNFAFGPFVDHQLKQKFFDLKDGTRIISSKNFCPLNFRINDRNMNDVEAIMKIRKLKEGNVSWTDTGISFYLHKISRKKLEQYKKGQILSNSDSEENKNDISTFEIKDEIEVKTNICETKTKCEPRIKKQFKKPNYKVKYIPKKTKITKYKYTKKIKPKFKKRQPTHLALNNLVRQYKKQMENMLNLMSTTDFQKHLNLQIELEKNRNEYLNQVAKQIEADIRNLKAQNLNLIKLRMSELNLGENPNTLISDTEKICLKNYQLREQMTNLEIEIKNLELENKQLKIKQEKLNL